MAVYGGLRNQAGELRVCSMSNSVEQNRQEKCCSSRGSGPFCTAIWCPCGRLGFARACLRAWLVRTVTKLYLEFLAIQRHTTHHAWPLRQQPPAPARSSESWSVRLFSLFVLRQFVQMLLISLDFEAARHCFRKLPCLPNTMHPLSTSGLSDTQRSGKHS